MLKTKGCLVFRNNKCIVATSTHVSRKNLVVYRVIWRRGRKRRLLACNSLGGRDRVFGGEVRAEAFAVMSVGLDEGVEGHVPYGRARVAQEAYQMRQQAGDSHSARTVTGGGGGGIFRGVLWEYGEWVGEFRFV